MHSVAWNAPGTRIVSGGRDRNLRIWDVETGSSLLTLRGHTSHVNSVAWSPSGTRIVSGSMDMTVRIWETGMSEFPFQSPAHVGLSLDGNLFKTTREFRVEKDLRDPRVRVAQGGWGGQGGKSKHGKDGEDGNDGKDGDALKDG